MPESPLSQPSAVPPANQPHDSRPGEPCPAYGQDGQSGVQGYGMVPPPPSPAVSQAEMSAGSYDAAPASPQQGHKRRRGMVLLGLGCVVALALGGGYVALGGKTGIAGIDRAISRVANTDASNLQYSASVEYVSQLSGDAMPVGIVGGSDKEVISLSHSSDGSDERYVFDPFSPYALLNYTVLRVEGTRFVEVPLPDEVSGKVLMQLRHGLVVFGSDAPDMSTSDFSVWDIDANKVEQLVVPEGTTTVTLVDEDTYVAMVYNVSDDSVQYHLIDRGGKTRWAKSSDELGIARDCAIAPTVKGRSHYLSPVIDDVDVCPHPYLIDPVSGHALDESEDVTVLATYDEGVIVTDSVGKVVTAYDSSLEKKVAVIDNGEVAANLNGLANLSNVLNIENAVSFDDAIAGLTAYSEALKDDSSSMYSILPGGKLKKWSFAADGEGYQVDDRVIKCYPELFLSSGERVMCKDGDLLVGLDLTSSKPDSADAGFVPYMSEKFGAPLVWQVRVQEMADLRIEPFDNDHWVLDLKNRVYILR